MRAGSYKDQSRLTASALDCAVRAGAPEDELSALEGYVCPTFGACPTMGTACTMQMLGEVLNLVMPGTSIIPADDNMKLRKSTEAGAYIVELVKKDIRPSQLITKETLLNAIIFDTAVAALQMPFYIFLPMHMTRRYYNIGRFRKICEGNTAFA